jgi:hypothetical protein
LPEKNENRYDKRSIFVWAVAFFTITFLAISNKYQIHYSKSVLLFMGIIVIIAISLFDLFGLLEGIETKSFKYGKRHYAKIITKEKNPIFYHFIIIMSILYIIAMYLIGIPFLFYFVFHYVE